MHFADLRDRFGVYLGGCEATEAEVQLALVCVSDTTDSTRLRQELRHRARQQPSGLT